MSPRAIAHALFRRRRLIGAILALAVSMGAGLAVWVTPSWRAEATLLADPRRADSAGALAALLESRDLHDEVLAGMGASLFPTIAAADRPAAFARALTATAQRESGLVRVTFDGPDPAAAAAALSALMDGVRARNATLFAMATAPQADALRKPANVFDGPAERDSLLKRRSELESQLVAAEADAAAAADRLALLRSRLGSIPATIAVQSESERTRVVDEARAKLFELQTKEQELLGKYQEDSTFVQRVQGERKKVQALLDQMLAISDTRVTQGTNQVHQEVEKDIIRTEASLSAAKARVRTATRQLADMESRLAAAPLQGPAVDAIGIVQGAAVAARPIGPGPVAIVAIAAAIGLALGLVLAALAQILSTRLSNPADVERRLGLPVLTTIPRES